MIKIFILYLISLFFLFTTLVKSQEYGSNTGFKLPRFVSLKSDETNLRIGSSINYPIILQYTIKNLPIKITEEYDSWRKIKDFEGNEGWIHKTILKGDRFGIINNLSGPYAKIYLNPEGKIIGEIGKKNKGWINKKNLWGVYENEEFNTTIFQPLIKIIWKINLYIYHSLEFIDDNQN